MNIDTNTLSKVLYLIEYYIHCPFSGRLEIRPEIEGAVYTYLSQVRQQLKTCEGSKPDRVAKSMRALYGLIWEPFKRAAEHNHSLLREIAEQNLVTPEFAELFVSVESELLDVFEEVGAGHKGCKRSKQ
jgi:hypothetical protein